MFTKQNNWLVILFASFLLALGAGCTSADSGGGSNSGNRDGDAVLDKDDNCPGTPNDGQEDFDNDNVGDACDDQDGDKVLDEGDNCKTVHNPLQANHDGDAFGDACDSDDDNDGTPDTSDACPFDDTNTCNEDSDSDGEPDSEDNCPGVPNPNQENRDGDEFGDHCDDDDDDGFVDAVDNCLDLKNEDQTDTDGDGAGDACDTDDDGDGEPDSVDNCPTTSNPEQFDSDQDGTGDACDGCDAVQNPDGEPIEGVQTTIDELIRRVNGAVLGTPAPAQLALLLDQLGCTVNTAAEPADTIADSLVSILELMADQNMNPDDYAAIFGDASEELPAELTALAEQLVATLSSLAPGDDSGLPFSLESLCAIPGIGVPLVTNAGGSCEDAGEGSGSPSLEDLCAIPGIGVPLVTNAGGSCEDPGEGSGSPSLEDLCAIPGIGVPLVTNAGGSCEGAGEGSGSPSLEDLCAIPGIGVPLVTNAGGSCDDAGDDGGIPTDPSVLFDGLADLQALFCNVPGLSSIPGFTEQCSNFPPTP